LASSNSENLEKQGQLDQIILMIILAYKNRKEALQSEMFSMRSHDSQQKKIQAILEDAPAHLDLRPLFMVQTADTAEEQQPFNDF
jgi:hypothetical protein